MALDFLTELILNFITDVFQDALAHVGDVILNFYLYAVEIFQTAEITSVTLFTTLLGAALCSLMAVKSIIGTYGLGTEGDPDQDSIEIVFRLCTSLGMMGINSWLFNEMLRFSTAVAEDVTRILHGSVNFSNDLNSTLLLLMSTSAHSPFQVVLHSSLDIGMILFAISAFLRGVEITLNKILLPIFAIDLVNTNPEKWKMFIFQYLMCFMSFIVQMFCYQMYLTRILNLSVIEFSDYVIMMGWLVFSIKAPKMLEKYIYATGTGQAVSRGASSIGQVIMFSMRR